MTAAHGTADAVTMDPADQNRFVRAHTSLYKKPGDRIRLAAVTRRVRAYARDVLPGLMDGRESVKWMYDD